MRILFVGETPSDYVKYIRIRQTLQASGADFFLSDVRSLGIDALLERDQVIDFKYHHWSVPDGLAAIGPADPTDELMRAISPERGDAVMVAGSGLCTTTATTLAQERCLPVIRLASGLRMVEPTGRDVAMRRQIEQSASVHLVATSMGVTNLLEEGVDFSRIHLVGNVTAENIIRSMPQVPGRASVLDRLAVRDGFILAVIGGSAGADQVTNVGAVAMALERAPLPVLLLADAHARESLERLGLDSMDGNVRLIDSLTYVDTLALQQRAAAIVTDCGEVEEEACVLGTPCVTVRGCTDWRVTVELGANRLAGPDADSILEAMHGALSGVRSWGMPHRWDGDVSFRISDVLTSAVMPWASTGAC